MWDGLKERDYGWIKDNSILWFEHRKALKLVGWKIKQKRQLVITEYVSDVYGC